MKRTLLLSFSLLTVSAMVVAPAQALTWKQTKTAGKTLVGAVCAALTCSKFKDAFGAWQYLRTHNLPTIHPRDAYIPFVHGLIAATIGYFAFQSAYNDIKTDKEKTN